MSIWEQIHVGASLNLRLIHSPSLPVESSMGRD